MKIQKKPTRFNHESKNILIDILSLVIILIGGLALLSYYSNKYTRQVDSVIIVIVLLLSIDSFLYLKHSKYKWQYKLLCGLFLLVAITHSIRLFFGPLQCSIYSKLISIYFYDSLAFLSGLSLFILSIYLIKKHSGPRYHHIAGILVGLAMIINHIIKISIGICV